MRQNLKHVFRTIVRWAAISISLSITLFTSAGTTRIHSIQAYLAVFSMMLFITMLAVDPQLARERSEPGPALSGQSLRFAAGFLFLLTLIVGSYGQGHLPDRLQFPSSVRITALVAFAACSSFQAWAMISNAFFSPVIRIQSERGHHLIDSGPYRFVRHPGYLGMSLSVLASAMALGSAVALIPALAFIFVIHRQARLEDEFLKLNLPGYALYAKRVAAGLPFLRSS